MESPLSGAGPQKSFWNTYAFNPFVADTKPGAAGYAGLSILMFMVAPIWGHGLLYLFVRMPFKAKQKEFMTETEAAQARKVDRAAAERDPLRRAKADLEEQLKVIKAENKRLHERFSNLKKNSSALSPKEYNEAQARISDEIAANMLKLGAVNSQIAEYERAPSPLSSIGSPSSAAPVSHKEEIAQTVLEVMQTYANENGFVLNHKESFELTLKDFFEDSAQLNPIKAKEVLVNIFSALRKKLINRMDKGTFDTLERLAEQNLAMDEFEAPSGFIPV